MNWVVAFLSLLILLTYLVFPIVAIVLAKFSKKVEKPTPSNTSSIYLLMAVHNEADVIQAKMQSIVDSNLDLTRLHCYIGADNCNDNTVNIIKGFSNKLNTELLNFKERQGKPAIINQLVSKLKEEHNLQQEDLFLLTDANVIFHPDFIKNISASFSDAKVGLVDGTVLNPKQMNATGESESVYVTLETQIKTAESKLWQCAMGPFGGAYMMRAALYQPVPNNFLVDDFYIAFHVVKSGYHALVDDEALCYEEVSGSFSEEFRRKIRISSGNFQNAMYFFPGYLKIWKKHNTIFILHKLLRWMTPIFGLIILILLGIMSFYNPISGKILLIMISLLVGCPLTNYLLNQLNLNLKPLQGVSYLIMMNLALLIGFFKFTKGIQSNVWEPTKRTVSTP